MQNIKNTVELNPVKGKISVDYFIVIHPLQITGTD